MLMFIKMRFFLVFWQSCMECFIINSFVHCSIRTIKFSKNGKKVAKTAILEFNSGAPEYDFKKFVRYFIVQDLK